MIQKNNANWPPSVPALPPQLGLHFSLQNRLSNACLIANKRDVLLGVAVSLAVVIGVAEASLVAVLYLLPLAWRVIG